MYEVEQMEHQYQNLSDLLKNSVAAEAYFSQLPEQAQIQAMKQSNNFHTQHDLREFAAQLKLGGN